MCAQRCLLRRPPALSRAAECAPHRLRAPEQVHVAMNGLALLFVIIAFGIIHDFVSKNGALALRFNDTRERALFIDFSPPHAPLRRPLLQTASTTTASTPRWAARSSS